MKAILVWDGWRRETEIDDPPPTTLMLPVPVEWFDHDPAIPIPSVVDELHGWPFHLQAVIEGRALYSSMEAPWQSQIRNVMATVRNRMMERSSYEQTGTIRRGR